MIISATGHLEVRSLIAFEVLVLEIKSALIKFLNCKNTLEELTETTNPVVDPNMKVTVAFTVLGIVHICYQLRYRS